MSGRQTEIPSSLNWTVIRNYADRHQITGIFYKQTRQPVFLSDYAAQIYRYTNFQNTTRYFQDTMKDFPYLMVKGAIVAELLPVPALRTMSDVDILIHPEDRDHIHKLLTDAGFQFRIESEGEWQYTRNGFLFEVHDSLVHRREELSDLVEYFSGVWDHVEGHQPDWSFHLIYLMEHLRHHFVGHGAGFRQFMDVAIVCKTCEIDWDFVKKELNKIHLLEFASTVFAFIREWFGISVPMKTKELSAEFYLEATGKIFEDGVFGFNNRENTYTAIASGMHYRDTDVGEAKRKYLFKRFFPSYEVMCRLPYVPYVRKSRALLPAAWIHRIVYRAFSRTSREYMRQQLSGDNIAARMNMLKQWGL